MRLARICRASGYNSFEGPRATPDAAPRKKEECAAGEKRPGELAAATREALLPFFRRARRVHRASLALSRLSSSTGLANAEMEAN